LPRDEKCNAHNGVAQRVHACARVRAPRGGRDREMRVKEALHGENGGGRDNEMTESERPVGRAASPAVRTATPIRVLFTVLRIIGGQDVSPEAQTSGVRAREGVAEL